MKRTSSFALVILLFIVLFTTQACFLFRNVTIAVENESLTIGVGESKQIEFKVKPEDATVKFSSSDESVASVSSTGVVVGVSEGETEITIEGTKDKYKTAVKKVGVQVVGEDYYSVTFTVSDSDGVIQGAEVSFNSDSKTTDSEGKAVFTDVLAGSKDYSVSKAGYDDATGTVEVDSDESVNVTLIKKTYTITASAGTGGSISPSGEVIVEHGSSKTFTMSPSEGYSVEDVLVDGESVGPRDTYTFSNITSNHTVSVSFTTLPPETYTVTFNVTDSEGTLQGAEVSFNGESKTTDVQGKAVFVNVLSGSKAYTVSKESYNNETGTVNVDSDRSVNVTLTKKTYTITASAGTGGSISPSGEVIVEHGSSKTFTMSPSEGYSVEDVLVDNESVGPRDTYTFYNITSSHTIYVSFATLPPETYTVTFNVSDSSGAVQGANVSFNGDNKGTDALGKAVFTGVLVGSRAYTVSKEGYNNSTGNVDVDGDESVDVTLTKKTYTLAVNIIGQGTVTKNPDEATYTHGEVVQLTANPADNWDFTGWSGDLAGSANPDTITMNSDKTVTANFSIVQYTITASAGTGGTISPSGQVKVNHGSNQSFSISANTGYDIQDVKVDGATEGAIGSYTFSNVTSDHTIAATFKIETYTISVSSDPAEGGSVNGGGTYNHGAQVSCQATANEGYRFVNWTEGGVVVSDNSTYTFNITANRNLVANFVRVYSVTFSVVDSEGVLQGAEVSFNGETKVTDVQGKAVFTGVVTGSKAYTVSKEGYNSAAGTIDVDSDESVDITLVKKTYTLSVSTVGQGTVTKNPDKATYTHGEVVQLTANPDSGWNFDSWSGDLTGSTNPANITMDSNKTVTATFTIKKYTIAASANPQAGGTVTGAGSYNHGDTVNLVATANEGYEFVNWTENGVQVSANTTYSFTATANRTLVANFRLKTYTINATAGAGGNINPAGSVNVTHGSSQSFTIIPNANYDIGDVKVDGVSVGAVSSYTFNNVIANHTIAATFKLKTYTLTANVVGQGTVTKNPSKPTYDHGEEVQLTATPDEGWDFTGWSGDLSGTANPANITMDSNKTVTATFTIKKYTIAASANPPAGGTVSGAGSYNHGDTVNLVATANEGYEFVNWTENGVQVSANTTYSFTATANRTLVANFRLKTYTITATAGAGGSIDPSGNVSVNHGDDQSFAITPDEGYNVEDVLIDGESVGPRTSYTFTGVASDHTIHASFSLLPPPTYTITFNVSDNQGAVQGASVTFYGETKATDAQGKATFTGVLAGNRAYTVSKTGYNNATGNVNVDGDETVDVILTKKTYTITATAGAGGNINPAGNVQVEHGSNRLFNITPNTGYEIEDVKVDGVSIGAVSTYNFTNVTTNHTIHATFRLKSYTIAVSANPPAGGTVSGAGSYNHGDTVNLVATANEGYEFVNWTENGVQVSGDPDYSFEAIGNRTLVANFTQKTYTLTINITGQGTVSRNPDKPTYAHGEIVRLTASPATNWNFKGWRGDLSGSTNPVNITMNADRNVTATFSTIQYTIAISANPEAGGTVTGGGIYNHGETVNLTALANRDYRFVNWTEAGIQVSTNSNYSFTARSDRTLVANFEEEVETGAFKVANSWGIGGWENVPDGFLYITYEAMKQNKVLCFVVDPKDNYEPRAIAVFKISHPVRDDCYVYVGVGNPSSPSREKRFDDFFYRGGPWPFPNNKMVLDITELLPFNNETLYLKVYDTKTGSTGTIEFFSVEIYDNYPSGVPSSVFISTQTPKNTVNNSYVNVQIPGVTVSAVSNYDLSSNTGGLSKRLLEGMKETMGVYEEGRDYNEIINGYGTGLRPPSAEEWEEIANSWYEMKPFGLQETLPVSLDHSSSVHFPPIGNQGSEGSCVAFSVGYYTATFYEACDRSWDLSGAQWVGGYYGAPTVSYQDRILSPDFIYHQINDGYDQGSAYQDAMKLISNIGVSSWKEMPYNPSDSKTWPSESAWREAPRYRSHTNVMRVLRVENDQDIQTLKSYINAGYLVSISVDAYKYNYLTANDVWNSNNYTYPNTNHANTIVGYDDSMSR